MNFLRMVPWWGWLILGVLSLVVWKRTGEGSTGGTGKVVGIVGRMGSGKSYFAVRMAYRRMMAGANVRTNFTMNLDPEHWHKKDANGDPIPCPPKCAKRRKCVCTKHCPCQVRERWAQFYGWEQIAELQDAVVIIDEAHLYAPSLDPRAIPDMAKWKMTMARKYRLDIYWLSQHESQVNRILRENLSNYIFVCSSWFGGFFFTAKGWEPHNLRRHRKHLERKAYRFQQHVADLYDTLQVIQGDQMVNRDGTMKKANQLAEEYNAARAKKKNQLKRLEEKLRADAEHEPEICGAPKKNGEPCQSRGRVAYGGRCHLHGERVSA